MPINRVAAPAEDRSTEIKKFQADWRRPNGMQVRWRSGGVSGFYRWVENPYFQYFCGEVVFQRELPFDRWPLTRWRQYSSSATRKGADIRPNFDWTVS
jgi:hypothetical protein